MEVDAFLGQDTDPTPEEAEQARKKAEARAQALRGWWRWLIVSKPKPGEPSREGTKVIDQHYSKSHNRWVTLLDGKGGERALRDELGLRNEPDRFVAKFYDDPVTELDQVLAPSEEWIGDALVRHLA